MTTLIIGGDHIEKIRRELSEFGMTSIEHWGGRKPADARREIPARVKRVVIVTDQLNHSMLYNATLRASRLDLPIIYTRRSGRELRAKLDELYAFRKTRRTQARFSTGWATPAAAFMISY